MYDIDITARIPCALLYECNVRDNYSKVTKCTVYRDVILFLFSICKNDGKVMLIHFFTLFPLNKFGT